MEAQQKKRVICPACSPRHLLPWATTWGALKNFVRLQDDYECSARPGGPPRHHRAPGARCPCARIAGGLRPAGHGHDLKRASSSSKARCRSTFSWPGCSPTATPARRALPHDPVYRTTAKHADNINAGLFTYPCLMAAGHFAVPGGHVPSGADQKQHLELTRNIAERFNGLYSPTFTVPDHHPQARRRIMSQDPTKKMSKSDENVNAFVAVLDDPRLPSEQFKRAVTDSDACVRFDPENKPGVSNLMAIYPPSPARPWRRLSRSSRGKG